MSEDRNGQEEDWDDVDDEDAPLNFQEAILAVVHIFMAQEVCSFD
jgi:hypothetical protein